MTSPITWSLSASALVSEASPGSRFSSAPPSPCSVWMISIERLLIWPGSNPWVSGSKPANSTVRSTAGCVCAMGMVSFEDSTEWSVDAPCSTSR